MLDIKLEILHKGITLTDAAREHLGAIACDVASDDYSTTSGLPLDLGDDYYVNAPFREKFVQTQIFLDWDLNGYFLSKASGGFHHRVKAFQLPFYHGEHTSSGVPFKEIVNTHTDRARISPILGCAFDCKFCDAPRRNKYRFHNTEDILEAVDAAINDPIHSASHFLISGGSPTRRDEDKLERVYQSVAQRSSVPVDVMMAPRRDLDCINRMRDFGINHLFVNLEGVGESISSIMKAKTKLGLGLYAEFLAQAVQGFGTGRVLSLIIAGLGSPRTTVESCELLCRLGVVPVLSPFRPARYTDLEDHPPPTPETLLEILDECEQVAEKYGLFLGPRCKVCNHNTLNRPETVIDPRNYQALHVPNLAETAPCKKHIVEAIRV